MEKLLPLWVKWVLRLWGEAALLVLVDETKLSDHLGVMMLGLAYQGRCIPLLWRCYVANSKADYPVEGQVGIIMDLLNQLKAALPSDAKILVQADRGIGNSNHLMRQIQQGGMTFMFRVKQRSVFRSRHNAKQAYPLSTLVKPGETWSGRGWLFKPSKMLRVQVHLAWKMGQPEPWCLVTNAPNLSAQTYALRMWQEEGFRDLKSFGWRWDTSHVWQPEHAHRLLLVLALAYAWVISQEVVLRQSPTVVQRLVERGTHPRFSVFRRALRYIRQALELRLPLLFDLRFIPSYPYV